VSSGRLADPLLRLLGADPATFRPLYRTQKLLLQRGVRVVQARRGLFAGSSPFRLLCFFAAVYGFSGCAMLLVAKSPLLGAVLALTMGCGFLLLVVVTDNFDVLVNPREMQVIGALPHDSRSFLLAKLAAIGRSLSILAAFLFGIPSLAATFAWGPAAGLGFLAGSAAAGISTGTFGLLLAAAILKAGGRRAMDRLMPWVQGLFQIGYFLVISGQRLVELSGMEGISPWLPWVAPPFWFASPLELALAGPTLPISPVLARLALAVATPALLLAGATRWLGAGLRERLLEPVQRAEPQRSRQETAHRRPLRSGSGERTRLFALLRVHLRSDWRVRSEFLMTPLLGIFLLQFYGGGHNAPGSSTMSVFFFAWLLMLSASVLIRSSRPESLWWILIAPIDRARFSLATVSLVRVFHLAPLFAALAVTQIRAGGPWPPRLALLAEMLALGDLLILMGKGTFPDFPFSQLRQEGGAGAGRTALTLVAGVIAGLATLAVSLFGLLGLRGILAGAAIFALLRIPAGIWARRRAAVAAEELELTASSVG
jgi:hypothetical protein